MSDTTRPTRAQIDQMLLDILEHRARLGSGLDTNEQERLARYCLALLDENANLKNANNNLQHRIAHQRSEIKNRLLQIYGMERENAWLRGIRKRVRTALGLDGETLQTTGISDPAEAAIRICSERDELRSENANLKRLIAKLPLWTPEDRAEMIRNSSMKETAMHDPLYGNLPKWYPASCIVDSQILVDIREAIDAAMESTASEGKA